MKNIWSQIRKLWQDSSASSAGQPALHEILERNQSFLDGQDEWIGKGQAIKWLKWIADQYTRFKEDAENHSTAIDFLDMPSSKGFVIHCQEKAIPDTEFEYLLDAFRDLVLKHEYKLYMSDVRMYNRPKWVEQTQRHYLKPRTKMIENNRIHQRYGNIAIELVFSDSAPRYFKFSNTYYPDRLYAPPFSFDQLVDEMFRK